MADYEFEQAQNDDKFAKGTVAALATLGFSLAGFIINRARDDNQKNKIDQLISQMQSQIDRKTDQYRAIDAKWLKSSAERAESERLKYEVSELKKESEKLKNVNSNSKFKK